MTQTPKVPESAQEVDLLGMDDDAFGVPTATATAGTNKALPVVALQAGPDGNLAFQLTPFSFNLRCAITQVMMTLTISRRHRLRR